VERLFKKRSGDGSGESGGNVGVHGSVQLGFLQQRVPNGEQAVGTVRPEMDQSNLFLFVSFFILLCEKITVNSFACILHLRFKYRLKDGTIDGYGGGAVG